MGCKDEGIRKSEFVAKTQFLRNNSSQTVGGGDFLRKKINDDLQDLPSPQKKNYVHPTKLFIFRKMDLPRIT